MRARTYAERYVRQVAISCNAGRVSNLSGYLSIELLGSRGMTTYTLVTGIINTGIIHHGCWYLNTRSGRFRILEGLTADLSDSPFTRQNPVGKCGFAAASGAAGTEYTIFGVTLGYCISGSNTLSDYQYVSSGLCQDNRGGYNQGYFIMDVYEINPEIFLSPSETTTLESETRTEEIEGPTEVQGRSGADAGAVGSMVSIVIAMLLTVF